MTSERAVAARLEECRAKRREADFWDELDAESRKLVASNPSRFWWP